ncbi:MAG TPA: hypothetical protein VFK05_19600 [Polyangiaceae bacterium]|nr:hypothetical protein [Polyangiaceae bacterium]
MAIRIAKPERGGEDERVGALTGVESVLGSSRNAQGSAVQVDVNQPERPRFGGGAIGEQTRTEAELG